MKSVRVILGNPAQFGGTLCGRFISSKPSVSASESEEKIHSHIDRLICAVLPLVVLFLLAIPSAMAAGEIWYGDAAGTASIYTATAKGAELCLWDGSGDSFRLISKDGQVSSFPATTILEATEMAQVSRSPLILVSDGAEYYSVELTVRADMASTSFEGAELYRLDFEKSASERVASLDLSDAIETEIDGSQVCLPCVGAKLADNLLYLLFETAPGDSAGLMFDDLRERFLLTFQLGNPVPMRTDLGRGAELIDAVGQQVMYALPAEGNAVQIMIADLAGGEAATGPILSNRAGRPERFAFNREAGLMYYSVGGRVWEAASTGESRLAAVLPIRAPSGLFLLSTGEIAAWCSSAIAVADIDPGIADSFTELSIFGTNEYVESFASAYPEITIAEYRGEASLIDLMLTRSEQPDVLILNTFNDPETMDLMGRGYLCPLQSEVVRETVSRMYPEVMDAVSAGGDVIALPYDHTAQPMLGVDEALWTELGLGEYPETWAEMMDFLRQWPEIQLQHPSIRLFMEDMVTAQNVNGWILSMLISDYEYFRQGAGESIGYDTDIFRNLLSQYASIDFENLLADQSSDPDRGLLMVQYTGTAEEAEWYGMRGLPLRVDENAPVYMPTSLSVIAINPHARNMEAALAFVEYVAQNLDPIAQTELMPDENAPVRWSSYEQDVADLTEKVASAQSKLDACDGAERAALEQELIRAQAALDDYESNGWMASPRSIAAYRAMAEHLHILCRDNIDAAEESAFDESCTRFLEGNLSVEQLISALESRYVMRAMEQG